jgi:hypothetical protein
MEKDELSEKEIAMMMTIARFTKDLIEEKSDLGPAAIRYYYNHYLNVLHRSKQSAKSAPVGNDA